MYIVYILKDINNKIYKGCTNNLDRRLNEHRAGKTKTTSRMIGITVIYTEEFKTRDEALLREKYFKSSAGRRWLYKHNILGV